MIREHAAARDGRLTVVLPTYNCAAYLPKALDSLLAQTRPADCIIVIDDASEDNTQEVLKRYQDRCAVLRVVTHEKNQGTVVSVNDGLKLVDSEYVTFFAADDWLSKDLFAKVLPLMNSYPQAPLCGVLVQRVDHEENPLPSSRDVPLKGGSRYLTPQEVLHHFRIYGRLFHGNGTVYRTVHLIARNGLDPALQSFADSYLITSLAAKFGACFVPEMLAFWRLHHTSYSATVRQDAARCMQILEAVLQRTKGEDTDCFPPVCLKRFEGRLRFETAMAAFATPQPSWEKGDEILNVVTPWLRWLIKGVARLSWPLATMAVLALVFRPWDIIPALKYRIFHVNK